MTKPQFREIDSSVGKTAKFLKRSSFTLLLALTAAIMIAAALIVLLTSCTAAPSARTIDAQTALQMIEDDPSAIIIDVRTQQEFGQGHIPNAVLLPNTEIEQRAAEILPYKDEKILLYCRTGRRSAEAAQKLIDMGYLRVYDFGGIVDWPYQIEIPDDRAE